MCPYVHIFEYDFPLYGIMMILGMTVAMGIAAIQCGFYDYSRRDAMLTALIAIAGGLAGAMLIRPVTRLPGIIINWERYSRVPVGDFLAMLFGEFVFYGGLIGGVTAVVLFCRFFKEPVAPIGEIFAPALPVGHAIGRIGCLLAGCCYGIEVSPGNPLAIIYPERTDGLSGLAAPAGTPLLALPLIEASGNILISCIVFLYQRKSKTDGRGIAVYGVLYGALRFTLEFFRGDLIRGVYGGISTSQIISVIVVAASVLWFILIPRKIPPKPQNPPAEQRQ